MCVCFGGCMYGVRGDMYGAAACRSRRPCVCRHTCMFVCMGVRQIFSQGDPYTHTHTHIHVHIYTHTGRTYELAESRAPLGLPCAHTCTFTHTHIHVHTYVHTGQTYELAESRPPLGLPCAHTCTFTHTHIHVHRQNVQAG
jgi:hypothetical protein